MSKNVISMLGAAVVAVVLVGSATQGCGGSSGGAGDLASLCNQGCTQEMKCGVPGSVSNCVATCEKEASCSNVDAIVAAGQKCLGITDCTALDTCGMNIPDCVMGSAGSSGGTAGTSGGGTAGTSGGGTAGASGGGTAGTSGGGTAGTSGTSAGTTCDTACKKADDCTKAIDAIAGHADASTTSLQASCDSAGATDQAMIVETCNSYLTSFASLLGAQEPAVCK